MATEVNETLLSTTIAGMTAASVESFVTYPLEYIKTRHQLFRSTPGSTFIAPVPSKIYYCGCSAIVIGNASKAMLRYSMYNQMTKFMADADGQTSAPQIVVAGMLTGMFESLLVVPFESIKTTMVDRSIKQSEAEYQRPTALRPREGAAAHQYQETTKVESVRPKVRPAAPPKPPSNLFPVNPEVYGFFGNVRDMYATRGLRAFVQGLGPTVMRQLSNSMVKFTTYNFLKQAVASPNEPISSMMAVVLGLTAGAIQVITTQPIDVVKTRMQGLNGLPAYRSSLLCCYRIFMEEGPTKLWVGTLPRLIKVSFSGGIVFTVYEGTNKLVSHAMKESPFAPS